MWISQITLNNVRSFKKINIALSEKINLFVGNNNSGKTTIIKTAFLVQQNGLLATEDARVRTNQSSASVRLEGSIDDFESYFNKADASSVIFTKNLKTNAHNFRDPNGNVELKSSIQIKEPSNFIYPFLSKRKVPYYNEQINSDATNALSGSLENIAAKILRVTSGDPVSIKKFSEACLNILECEIATVDTVNGRKGGYFVDRASKILLDNMGEGVANIVGLIEMLLSAKGKLFLIEEIENDLHPKALKLLLKMIIESSSENQFIISTHSNIVLKYLGANKQTKIFNTKMEIGSDRIPSSSINEVTNSIEDRKLVLEDLGYDFFDFDFWSAWLFLEESSSEQIIRDYLIPWFSPNLSGRLRTFSAGGFTKIEPKFQDFNDLFVYLYLEPSYKNKVWVLIDAGNEEEKIILKLRGKYKASGWDESHFGQLSQHDFEKYYPENFKQDVDRVLALQFKDEKRKEKEILLGKVVAWIKEDNNQARLAFEKSANEVIQYLKTIEATLNK